MFTRPIDGIEFFPRTAEEKAREEAILLSLVDLFLPHVRDEVGAHVAEELDRPSGDADDARAMGRLAGALCLTEGRSVGETKRAIRQVRAEVLAPRASTPEEKGTMLRTELLEESSRIVAIWLDTLSSSAQGFDGRDAMVNTAPGDGSALGTWISASSLDDAMLPPMPLEAAEAFAQAGILTHAGVRGARRILARVRAALPAGKALPDAAIDYLALERVSLVP